ncbi:cytochrome d ubiquinol oxidase subunit II [Massilibacterium senegalense]|uniref:cytochrome d ubiquinol oxidase subunit II n=1 Tax=Massilibacterium senegalense TaxID=1632858 RepID=UPI000782F223|nr:cytochrome d ubiquinol oxidase subunit II [Massilibacterium senegalense]
MSHETLAIIWFVLWGVIWAMYFMLDAYGLGTGMLFPFVTKNDQDQKQLQQTIGPFWGGNEVWLITAGGATFAAFPLTYALMFSFLYTPLMIILFALFFRAAGLEFMHKHSTEKWKNAWKWAFFTGSFIIPLFFGVAFANLFDGLLIRQNGPLDYVYEGSLISLLTPYGLLGGLLFVTLFLVSGATWIGVKNEGPVVERSWKIANIVWPISLILLLIFFVATNNQTPLLDKFADYPILYVLPLLSVVFLILVKPFLKKKQFGKAFGMITASIATFMATGFAGMFPNMLPSKIDAAYSIQIMDAAGSALNLKIMFIVALIFVPIVLAYQLTMYRVFRKKITPENATGYDH